MASARPTYQTKDPEAVLDYRFDWSTWLDGDTITTHEILNPDGNVTIDSDTADDTSVTVWISGGAVDTDTTITCRVTTAQGRTDDACLRIYIRDC